MPQFRSSWRSAQPGDIDSRRGEAQPPAMGFVAQALRALVPAGQGVGVTLITDPAAPVVLFPGQGSQTPEMRDLVAERAPDLLERCVALVGEDPFPRASDSTRFAQPAIFCASLAGWDALDLDAVAGAGHSLGELAALAAAGVLERDDALRLVVLRGKLMAEADTFGSMVALIGAT